MNTRAELRRLGWVDGEWRTQRRGTVAVFVSPVTRDTTVTDYATTPARTFSFPGDIEAHVIVAAAEAAAKGQRRGQANS